MFADVLQNRWKISQNSQETPTLESLFNKAADLFYYRKLAVAVCGYFKNNLQLILYGVELRSCQCLFNLIPQFYVQNQKYKFEKKTKKEAWHLFKYISKHTKTALNYKEHLRTTASFYLEIFPVFPIFPKRNNFTDFFHANGR